MPKVSIIVPVYKAEAYLNSCVDSILQQTFSDFDVYLVDDGSPDRCGDICEEYAARDSRVHVLHQENRGQAAARNRALELTQAPWVCFVDSDDLIHPQMLQRLLEAAETFGAGVSMCAMVEAPELPENFLKEPDGEVEVLEITDALLADMYERDTYPAWVACAKLIRRDHVMTHLFCEGKIYEDNEAVCHWVCEGRRLVRMNDPMYYYRTTPGSTTQRVFSRKAFDLLWALEQIIRYYGSIGYTQTQNRFLHRYGQELIVFYENSRYLLKDPKLATEVKKRGKTFVKKEKLRFSRQDMEKILEVMDPKRSLCYRVWGKFLRILRKM